MIEELAGSQFAVWVQATISGHLRPLLEHSEGEVRARACNVVGNLCRYNTTFYEPILEAGLIEVLIDRCRDFDRGTRKFATFAIGNAGEPLEVIFLPDPASGRISGTITIAFYALCIVCTVCVPDSEWDAFLSRCIETVRHYLQQT